MVIFLVIIGLMAGIALASYLYEQRHGTSRANRRNDHPNEHWDDTSASEELNDSEVGVDED